MAGHGGGGEDRWLLTYADLITLLLAYFIVMFAISQTDLEKFEKLAASMRRAFNVVDLGVLEGSSQSGTGLFTDFPTTNRQYLQINSELTRLAREQGLESEISVNTRREGVLISVSASLLFNAGSAQIRPESKPTLDAIADLLRELPNEVRIAGHTDDVSPVPEWPSNWELSAARAIQVVKYLTNEGVEPQRLAAVGYGEQQPLFPNDTPEHRKLNRRVEILIVFETADQAISSPIDSVSFEIEGIPPRASRTEGIPVSQRSSNELTQHETDNAR